MSSRCAFLSDAQWEFIAALLPDSSGRAGRPFNDHRLTTEGIIYRYRAGIPCRDLPPHFGAWQSVWKRHRRYSLDGTWDQVLAVLLTRVDAAGLINWEVPVLSEPEDHAIGRSRGGLSKVDSSPPATTNSH